MATTSTATSSTTLSARTPSAAGLPVGVGLALAGSLVGVVVVAQLALAVDPSPGFAPLTAPAYLVATTVGVLVGALGWAGVRRWARRPAALVRWLAPTVVALSLVPDVAMFFGTEPGATRVGVVGLMVMHLLVAAVTVPAFSRTAPLSD